MTTGEFAEMRRMWAAGIPVKNISRDIGYTQNYVYVIAMQHRDLFPSRHKTTRAYDQKTKEELVSRIRSGATISETARDSGVSRTSLQRWLKELP